MVIIPQWNSCQLICRWRWLWSLPSLLPCCRCPKEPLQLLLLPLGASNWFMGWFSPEEIQSLEEWARALRAGRMEPDFRIPEPEVTQNFRSGLRFLLVTQWEFVLVHPAGEVQFEVFRALVLRFNILTVNNRRQFQRGFSLWSAAERREQLEYLANSRGFLVVE